MNLSSILMLSVAATPLALWVFNIIFLGRRLHWGVLFLLSCVIGYVLLLAAVWMVDFELRRIVDQYEAGAVGVSKAEAEQAMDDLAADTGRALAPFTGPPIMFIWTSMNFVVLGLIQWVYRIDFLALIRSSRSEAVPERQHPDSGDGSGPSENNPYEPSGLRD